MEQDEEKIVKILEVLNIYETNAFLGKVKTELLRFRSIDSKSCKKSIRRPHPNAKACCAGSDEIRDPWKVIAISKINPGEEIVIARYYLYLRTSTCTK